MDKIMARIEKMTGLSPMMSKLLVIGGIILLVVVVYFLFFRARGSEPFIESLTPIDEIKDKIIDGTYLSPYILNKFKALEAEMKTYRNTSVDISFYTFAKNEISSYGYSSGDFEFDTKWSTGLFSHIVPMYNDTLDNITSYNRRVKPWEDAKKIIHDTKMDSSKRSVVSNLEDLIDKFIYEEIVRISILNKYEGILFHKLILRLSNYIKSIL